LPLPKSTSNTEEVRYSARDKSPFANEHVLIAIRLGVGNSSGKMEREQGSALLVSVPLSAVIVRRAIGAFSCQQHLQLVRISVLDAQQLDLEDKGRIGRNDRGVTADT
jgi:hypothetical protein